MQVARQLDPLSAIINADQGELLYCARRYEETRVRLRQAIELEPDFGQPHQTLALIGLESGHTSDALKEARAALALDPIDPRTIGEAGYVLAAAGQTAEARKLLATLNDMVHRGSAYPVYAALIHMGLGQRNEALDAIEENGDAKIYGDLVQWHVFEELKTDPRYQKLVAKAREIRTSRPSPDVSAQ
jgi:serine/threonine-protein kinase